MTPLLPQYGPVFRPFDRLTADNLTEWQCAPLFIMARHFHALHRLYGVAAGLRIIRDNGNYLLTPGVAYDAYSRPLVVEGNRNIQPQGKEDQLLVLTGDPPVESALHVPVPAPVVCTHKLVKHDYPPLPHEVILARINADTQKPDFEFDLSVRTNAIRSFHRPFISRGRVPRGTTVLPLTLQGKHGWKLWVDTKSSGFLPGSSTQKVKSTDSMGGESGIVKGPPVYFVTFAPQLEPPPQAGVPTQSLIWPTPEVTISEASHQGFLLQVVYSAPPREFTTTPVEFTWLGVEHQLNAAEHLEALQRPSMTEEIPMTRVQTRKTLPWPVFAGERRLEAEDLNQVQHTLREMQWLHNRSLHDWGVGEGLAVSAMTNRRGVIIEPGVAFDIQGHEIILSETKSLLVPPQRAITNGEARQHWWVTANYWEETRPRDHAPGSRTEGITQQRWPEASIRWTNPDDTVEPLRPGTDVILASVVIERGIVIAISSEGRRSAVPPKMPYLFASRAQGKLSRIILRNESKFAEMEMHLDTASAQYQSTPVYLVQAEQVPPQPFDRSPPEQPEGERKTLTQAINMLVDRKVPFELQSIYIVDSKADLLVIRAVIDLTLQRSILEKLTGLIPLFGSTDKTSPIVVTLSNGDRETWLQEKILSMLPYQFAWLGVEG